MLFWLDASILSSWYTFVSVLLWLVLKSFVRPFFSTTMLILLLMSMLCGHFCLLKTVSKRPKLFLNSTKNIIEYRLKSYKPKRRVKKPNLIKQWNLINHSHFTTPWLILPTHVAAGCRTSFFRGMSCAIDLVPVSTAHWRRRLLEKSSCLSSIFTAETRGYLKCNISPRL